MLTETEKKILGVMTDEGTLRNGLREQVAASDDLAREIIAKYKAQRLTSLSDEIANLETNLAALLLQQQLLELI